MNWLNENSNIVTVIISIIGCVGAIVGWIKSQKASQLAKQYAENADEANKSAKQYYDEMHKHLEKQSEIIDRDAMKTKILVAFAEYNVRTLHEEALMEYADCDVYILKKLLLELQTEGKIDKITPLFSVGTNAWAWKIKE